MSVPKKLAFVVSKSSTVVCLENVLTLHKCCTCLTNSGGFTECRSMLWLSLCAVPVDPFYRL